MGQKRFKGKAIYQPTGKAAEYSPWACNFYTGCSNDCEYCYCKRGVLNHVWSTEPRLKKCFRSEEHALRVFVDEMFRNIDELRKRGILFSFTTDPMLPKTRHLTFICAQAANEHGVPVKILTKRADFLDYVKFLSFDSKRTAFGFTLTGFDEKEPGASTNQERIDAMRKLHEWGFKTFASIEPVIDPLKSMEMINRTLGICDLYKVGLISGKGKSFYDDCHLAVFWSRLIDLTEHGYKIYPKDSLLNYLCEDRDSLEGYFVGCEYNMFN